MCYCFDDLYMEIAIYARNICHFMFKAFLPSYLFVKWLALFKTSSQWQTWYSGQALRQHLSLLYHFKNHPHHRRFFNLMKHWHTNIFKPSLHRKWYKNNCTVPDQQFHWTFTPKSISPFRLNFQGWNWNLEGKNSNSEGENSKVAFFRPFLDLCTHLLTT